MSDLNWLSLLAPKTESLVKKRPLEEIIKENDKYEKRWEEIGYVVRRRNHIPRVFGCMNPSSVNYNPSANINDGSCVIPVQTIDMIANIDPVGSPVNVVSGHHVMSFAAVQSTEINQSGSWYHLHLRINGSKGVTFTGSTIPLGAPGLVGLNWLYVSLGTPEDKITTSYSVIRTTNGTEPPLESSVELKFNDNTMNSTTPVAPDGLTVIGLDYYFKTPSDLNYLGFETVDVFFVCDSGEVVSV